MSNFQLEFEEPINYTIVWLLSVQIIHFPATQKVSTKSLDITRDEMDTKVSILLRSIFPFLFYLFVIQEVKQNEL